MTHDHLKTTSITELDKVEEAGRDVMIVEWVKQKRKVRRV